MRFWKRRGVAYVSVLGPPHNIPQPRPVSLTSQSKPGNPGHPTHATSRPFATRNEGPGAPTPGRPYGKHRHLGTNRHPSHLWQFSKENPPWGSGAIFSILECAGQSRDWGSMVRKVGPEGSQKGQGLVLCGTPRLTLPAFAFPLKQRTLAYSASLSLSPSPLILIKQVGKEGGDVACLRSMLLPGPLNREEGQIPLFWPLFSSSSPFQSEPVAVPRTPILTVSPNILRL